jgi:dipeptidyl aminopeptidase/acylaminoacyl peptidase
MFAPASVRYGLWDLWTGANVTADVRNTPFHDLADYMAIPRVGTLLLSPDGSWLAATVATLSPDRKKYLTSIWRIDPDGGPARRLTRSAEGEASPAFMADGSLLFVSRRPDPDADADGAEDKPALWLLPADGGEARLIVSLPGGVEAVTTARDRDTIVVGSQAMLTAGHGEACTQAEDGQLRKDRRDAGVTAILHESAPVRYWDHDLGPAQLRLFAVDHEAADPGAGRDLTPEPGRALDEQAFELTPDGTAVITGWWHRDPGGDSHVELVEIDVASGRRRTLLGTPGRNYERPHVSPDGRLIVCSAEEMATADRPTDMTLMIIDGDKERDLLPGLDRWPGECAWSPDSGAVYFAADDDGRCPIFRVDVRTGQVRRVTGRDGAYMCLCPSPDGRYLYALRTAVDQPPTPVRIDLHAEAEAELDCPGVPVALPGHLAELETTADDGQRIRSWLVLPEQASAEHPAPLLLWAHGGPHSTWNAWAWRWNPWLMAARGYAVLLPDPALSTGYGQHQMARGQREWAGRAYADVMAATDGALTRPDLDGTRTAMMGGSYGGYMANWIAGHTDRFRAIVSHASLWALDQMMATTDAVHFFYPQFGDPLIAPAMYEENSPHLHVAKISTPMLVIHGNRDYRVPLSEGLRLWWDLNRHQVPAKFLYFPDENHWILSPGNARIWYETVFAFLAEHVLGEPWRRPGLL